MKRETRVDPPMDSIDTSGRRWDANKTSKIIKQIIKQYDNAPTYNDYCQEFSKKPREYRND